jgi:sec-independent protein translocase protein TatA
MAHLGMPELLIILFIFVLIFGVGRLPELGRALGQGIRESREGAQGLVEEDTTPAGPNESNKG